MKNKKYKITDYGWQEGNKFCKYCGHKNILYPDDSWDGKTGRQHAFYQCTNKNCTFGKAYAYGCMDGHNYSKSWIFGESKCTRCGEYEPSYPFI